MTFKEQFYEEFEEARELGLETGRKEGLEEGEERGKRAKAIEAARNVLAMNLTIEQAAQISSLSVEEVRSLQNN